MRPDDDAQVFARAIVALAPYLDVLVLSGGWAHRLFRFHPLATPSPIPPLMTRDADFAAPERVQRHGAKIGDLLGGAGFQERLLEISGHTYTAYVLGDEDDGFSVELIAPLVGSATRRDGTANQVATIGGAKVPKLRFVELLLEAPWALPLDESTGFATAPPELRLRVVNPASYLAQKILSIPKRRGSYKKEKDALYVYDTLALFHERFDEVAADAERVVGGLPARTRRELHRLRTSIFDGDIAAGAAVIARDSGRPNPPTAEMIARACRVGLDAVFGDT